MFANYFMIEVLIGARFINPHVNYILCINQQVKFTKGIILVLEIALKKPSVRGLKPVEDNYSEPTADTPTRTMD